MAEVGRWNGFTFLVSPTLIRGFIGLTIKGACETKDKAQNKQQYVTRKRGKPSEVSLTVVLSAALGSDVRSEALNLVKSASEGAKDYFYVGDSKLLACKLMLVDATVKEAVVGSGVTWVSAQVQLTMKQCDKSGGSPEGGGGGGGKKKKKRKKKSVKKSSTTKKPSSGVDAVSRAAPSVSAREGVRRVVNAATNTVRRIVNAARNLTTNRRTTTSGGGGGTRYNMTR